MASYADSGGCAERAGGVTASRVDQADRDELAGLGERQLKVGVVADDDRGLDGLLSGLPTQRPR